MGSLWISFGSQYSASVACSGSFALSWRVLHYDTPVYIVSFYVALDPRFL